ncbi:SGNH/GDSL hydrolase family protein [Agromyces cerinus]|uniref:Lysophospholipase L1 n=1 Tax=Agromyces cerinus subsp. cerinus TaxID=232089 RepID=A0A1N6IA01_9MICO|nr:SGNH/GDSL hydrolase family protein [Agromyces cerinus]SIO28851.1 Lysophospholipase L1 [Agromyces cerinus subsp. cerinus]
MSRYVFIGDSITDCGRVRDDPSSLGDGYVSLLAAELLARSGSSAVVNLGISGDRAVDLERRWGAEVTPSRPDVLTVFVGVNDMWRRFDADDPTSAEAFERSYRTILADAVSASNPRLLLMDPFFVPVRGDQRAWLDDLGPKREVVARLGSEFGADVVPLHELMTDAASAAASGEIVPDGVHPTMAGHRLIADAWLSALDSRLSSTLAL